MKEKVPCNVHPDEVSPAQLTNLNQPFGLIKSTIGCFANTADFIAKVGTVPPVNGPYKAWRDNSFLWFPDKPHAYYLFVDRFSFLDLTQGPNFQEPWRSSFTCAVMGLGITNFLAEHKQSLRRVPKIYWMKWRKEDALALSFPTTDLQNSANYPVGELLPWDGISPYLEILDPETNQTVRVQSDWNTQTFLRYDPANSSSVVVEFTRDFVPVAPSAPEIKLSDSELVSAASGLIASPLALPAKAAGLRKLAVS